MEKTYQPYSNILLVFYSFWATVLSVRAIIFESLRHGITPAVYLDSFHIHHFAFGFLVLIMFVAIRRFFSPPPYILPVLLGMGMGLIADEFLYWTRLKFHYWSFANFYAMAFSGSVTFFLYLYYQRKGLPDRRESQTLLRALLPVYISLLLLFSLFHFSGGF